MTYSATTINNNKIENPHLRSSPGNFTPSVLPLRLTTISSVPVRPVRPNLSLLLWLQFILSLTNCSRTLLKLQKRNIAWFFWNQTQKIVRPFCLQANIYQSSHKKIWSMSHFFLSVSVTFPINLFVFLSIEVSRSQSGVEQGGWHARPWLVEGGRGESSAFHFYFLFICFPSWQIPFLILTTSHPTSIVMTGLPAPAPRLTHRITFCHNPSSLSLPNPSPLS